FFFSSRRRHTRFSRDWSSDVCSSDLFRRELLVAPWKRKMSRIFLSHSSKDNGSAVALRDWLAGQGWDDVFLDLDPQRGIAAGDRSEERRVGKECRSRWALDPSKKYEV